MKLSQTLYTAYEFTEDEEIVAPVFTDLQLARILTERANVASEKASLVPDPDNPQQFHMAHEYLRGQLEVYNYLVNTHTEAVEKQKYLHMQQQAMQQEDYSDFSSNTSEM
jgi:hypothetical protein